MQDKGISRCGFPSVLNLQMASFSLHPHRFPWCVHIPVRLLYPNVLFSKRHLPDWLRTQNKGLNLVIFSKALPRSNHILRLGSRGGDQGCNILICKILIQSIKSSLVIMLQFSKLLPLMETSVYHTYIYMYIYINHTYMCVCVKNEAIITAMETQTRR